MKDLQGTFEYMGQQTACSTLYNESSRCDGAQMQLPRPRRMTRLPLRLYQPHNFIPCATMS